MRYFRLSLLTFILISSSAFAQEDVELFSINISWDLGEKKVVKSTSRSVFYIADTVYSKTEVESSFLIEVVGVGPKYRLKIFQEQNQMSIGNETADPNLNKMMDVVRELTDSIGSMAFIVEFDPETGTIDNLVNREEILNQVKILSKQFVSHFIPEESTIEEQEKMTRQMQLYFSSMENEIIETCLNSMRLLFQPYSYNFPDNATYSEEILTEEMNAIDPSVDEPIPAILTLQCKDVDEFIHVNESLEYDKENMLAQFRSKGKGNSISAEDLDIIEESFYIINMETTWIKSYSSRVDVTFPSVRVLQIDNYEYSDPE